MMEQIKCRTSESSSKLEKVKEREAPGIEPDAVIQ
jgi:hypothetical protein